jgi:hypothetical protein
MNLKETKLPSNVKEFFYSDTPRLELERSCFMFGISDFDVEKISEPIGLIFLDDFKLENLPHVIWEKLHIEKPQIYGLAYEINKRMFAKFPEYFRDAPALLEQWSGIKSNPVISEDQAWKKVLEIEPWISEEGQEQKEQVPHSKKEENYKPTSEKLSIIEAIKTYPDLGEQLITTDQIRVRHFQEPVRPSVKNWISDYTVTLGYENHSSIERGNYLFQTENTKNLSYLDRQKLSQVLKSFDEKIPLEIDLQSKKIIFSQPAPERRPEPKPAPVNIPPPIKPRYSARPVENNRPTYISNLVEQKPREANTKTSSDMYANMPIAPVMQSVYQPKTKEPGNDFEKVIQFEEKKNKNSFSGNQRVVNLKEQEKERPVLPKPPVKNLLNIKELIEISKEEGRGMPPAPISGSKTEEIPVTPIKTEQNNVSSRFNMQKLAKQDNFNQEKPLSSANNFIHHNYSPASDRASWTNKAAGFLDETEKKLFESNNNALDSAPTGASIRNFSKVEKTGNLNIQFSSSQKLPHEKEQEEIEKKPVKPEKIQPSQAPIMQPYRIHPASFEDN